VKRLAIVFGEPKTEDPVGFLAEYANAFKGTPRDILDAAADVIIKQRKFRAWPTVAECLDAIDAARKQVVQNGIRLEPIENFDTWWAALVARVQTAQAVEEIDAAMWIGKWRLPSLQDMADIRRGQLTGTNILHLSETSKRMTGDRG
jgi:hypothetical protein